MKEIKNIKNEFAILEKEDEIKFSIKKSNGLKIDVYDEELLENMISTSFTKKYQKLLYIVTEILESDDSSESDIELVLLKIEDLKNLLLNSYSKYISRLKLNKYLKMLVILEGRLNNPMRNNRGKSR